MGSLNPETAAKDSETRWVVGAVLTLLAPVVASLPQPLLGIGILSLVMVVAVFHKTLLQWHVLISLLFIVILLVPIKGYYIALPLPYAAEPYRLMFLMIIATMAASWLVDPNFNWKPTVFGRYFAFYSLTALVSVVVGYGRIFGEVIQVRALGSLLNLGVFVLVFLAVRLSISRQSHADQLLRVLVVGAAVVAIATMFESRTGYRIFDHLNRYIPYIRHLTIRGTQVRGGVIRASGSAQHSIALGAMLAMVLPLSLYLFARRWRQRRVSAYVWIVGSVVILGGVAASISRTAALMVAVTVLVALLLRPRLIAVLVPAALIGFTVVALVLPGTASTLLQSFRPTGGLLAEQQGAPGTTAGGRLGDLPVVLSTWIQHPFFGVGYGTRLVTGERINALILDNEYFGRAVETGALGLLGFLLLILSPIIKTWRAARSKGSMGDLEVALCASFVAHAVGLYFYDGFSFFQSTFVFLALLGVAGWILTRSGLESGSQGATDLAPERQISTSMSA